MYFSMFSAYCMSKAGVELFSDVLRLEMIKWGVKVSTIFPAGFDTNKYLQTHPNPSYVFII